MLPAPLPVERERYIVVEIVGGLANAAVVHLPAHRILEDRAVGGPTFDRYEFPPAEWPSACRRVPRGSVYLQAGVFAAAPICLSCERALTPKQRRPQQPRGARLEVLALLENGPVTTHSVALARGTSAQSASQTLLRMLERGLVVMIGRGTYSLPDREAA